MTNPGTTLERGSIVLILFPYSDLSSHKKRPVLLVTAPDRHSDFIAAGITSVEQKSDAFLLESSQLLRGRLPRRSWVADRQAFYPEFRHRDQGLRGGKSRRLRTNPA